jgi:hypothetical protein
MPLPAASRAAAPRAPPHQKGEGAEQPGRIEVSQSTADPFGPLPPPVRGAMLGVTTASLRALLY